MNLLDHHLHRLFLDHDCIVVPGLGGFVCNRKPAKYDDSRQELIPPSRSILFNERIVHHDGVLVQSIARKLQISLDEALVQVEAESAALKAEMQGGKTVRIQQVGRLFFGEQGHMMFMPDEEMERIFFLLWFEANPPSSSQCSDRAETCSASGSYHLDAPSESCRKPSSLAPNCGSDCGSRYRRRWDVFC